MLYIGPRPSHVSELLEGIGREHPCAAAGHGEVDRVVQAIERLRQESRPARRRTPTGLQALFSEEVLLPRLIEELESG